MESAVQPGETSPLKNAQAKPIQSAGSLPPKLDVWGTVVDRDGKPVPNAEIRVTFWSVDNDVEKVVLGTFLKPEADSDGCFRASVETPDMLRSHQSLVAMRAHLPDYDPGLNAYVDVNGLAEIGPITLLLPVPSALRARLVYEDGSPVAQTELQLWDYADETRENARRTWVAKTDQHGWFEVAPLHAGRFWLGTEPMRWKLEGGDEIEIPESKNYVLPKPIRAVSTAALAVHTLREDRKPRRATVRLYGANGAFLTSREFEMLGWKPMVWYGLTPGNYRIAVSSAGYLDASSRPLRIQQDRFEKVVLDLLFVGD